MLGPEASAGGQVIPEIEVVDEDAVGRPRHGVGAGKVPGEASRELIAVRRVHRSSDKCEGFHGFSGLVPDGVAALFLDACPRAGHQGKNDGQDGHGTACSVRRHIRPFPR